MTKLVMALGGAGLAALATVLTLALAGTPDPARTVGTLPATTADVSGPCDEAEHAGDPRCAGTTTRAEDDGRRRAGDRDDADDRREPGEDIPGPCDEAEHANDPRCTGAAPAGRSGPSGPSGDDDHSGPGHGNDDGNDEGNDDDDRDGSNSGPGGGDDDRSGSNSGRG